MEYLKKHKSTIIVVAIFLIIGSFIYRGNMKHQAELAATPAVNHYYVFQDYPNSGEEAIMKIKSITENELEFYVPHGEIIGGFEPNTSESVVKNADTQGNMYGEETMIVSKVEVAQLLENNGFSGHMEKKPRIEFIFQ